MLNLNPADWCGVQLCGGRYQVMEKLGEGGMGYVYKAIDIRREYPVVIKVPNTVVLQSKEHRKRFEREYLALRNLSHPNIVQVYEARQAKQFNNIPYAVMEYMAGGDLCGRLSRDPKKLHDWLIDIALAIDYVHQRSHIHRDIKPGNILFDGSGEPHLSDFGVIKLAEELQSQHTNLTEPGFIPGTPDYMAPEMHDGEGIDGRVDQYALAVIVYEALAGEKPYKGKTPIAVAFAHKTEDPQPLSNVSQELEQAIMRGLAKKPNHRFKTCLEFAHAVISLLPEGRKEPCPKPATQTNKDIVRIAEKVRAILMYIDKYLTQENCEQIFGSNMAPFYNAIDLREFVCVCLSADVFHIVVSAVYADDMISDDEAHFVYPLLKILVGGLANKHLKYDRFQDLRLEQVCELLAFHKQDHEPFGYQCVKTKSIGLKMCCNVRQYYGDDKPSLLYDTMLYDLTSHVLRVDGMTEEEKNYLNQIEKEIVQRVNRHKS